MFPKHTITPQKTVSDQDTVYFFDTIDHVSTFVATTWQKLVKENASNFLQNRSQWYGLRVSGRNMALASNKLEDEMKHFCRAFIAVTAATVIGTLAGTAMASSIVIEDFGTGAPGQLPDPYTSQGFIYDPTKATAGQCFSGICLQEDTQGTVTTITQVGGGVFDFLGLYVNFNGIAGNTPTSTNLLTITGIRSASSNSSLSVSVVTPVSSPVLAYDEAGDSVGLVDFRSAGFFLAFQDDYFDGVDSIKLLSSSTASIRVDCVALSSGGGNLSAGSSELTACDPNVAVVPLPPALPMLGAGVLALGWLGRRRFSA